MKFQMRLLTLATGLMAISAFADPPSRTQPRVLKFSIEQSEGSDCKALGFTGTLQLNLMPANARDVELNRYEPIAGSLNPSKATIFTSGGFLVSLVGEEGMEDSIFTVQSGNLSKAMDEGESYFSFTIAQAQENKKFYRLEYMNLMSELDASRSGKGPESITQVCYATLTEF